jgi:hypothetical protein
MVSIHITNENLTPIKIWNMKGKLPRGSWLWEDGNRLRGLATRWPTYSGNARGRKEKNVLKKGKP